MPGELDRLMAEYEENEARKLAEYEQSAAGLRAEQEQQKSAGVRQAALWREFLEFMRTRAQRPLPVYVKGKKVCRRFGRSPLQYFNYVGEGWQVRQEIPAFLSDDRNISAIYAVLTDGRIFSITSLDDALMLAGVTSYDSSYRGIQPEHDTFIVVRNESDPFWDSSLMATMVSEVLGKR